MRQIEAVKFIPEQLEGKSIIIIFYIFIFAKLFLMSFSSKIQNFRNRIKYSQNHFFK